MNKNGLLADQFLENIQSEHDLQAFYSSRVLLSVSSVLRAELLGRLRNRFQGADHVLKIEFLEKAFADIDAYHATVKDKLRLVCAEDIIHFFEHVLVRIRNQGIAPDGISYDDEVLSSQHDHLTTVLADVLAFIREENIPFTGQRARHKQKQCAEFAEAFSRFHSVLTTIIEVLHGAYQPRRPSHIDETYGHTEHVVVNSENECLFFLANRPEYWTNLEIYRDLNYGYQIHQEDDPKLLTEALKQTRVLSVDTLTSITHVNLSKCEEVAREIKFQNTAQLLIPIYGDLQTEFEFNGKAYPITDLVCTAKQISAAADRIENRCRSGEVLMFGPKGLYRFLNIQRNKEPLVELFCFDCSGDEDLDPRFLPLVKNGNIYYLIPSQIQLQSCEKVIDKILSRASIKVLLGGVRKKGQVFEESVRRLIQASGYKWGDINRDERKNIPEIDGIFAFSENHLIIYEAKCTIKPEERREAYSFIENHLEKAVRQLSERVDFLETRADEAEARLRFSVRGLQIVPIILTNHSYFTGLGSATAAGVPISIIDIDLFERIIVSKKVPSWAYDHVSNTYVRTLIELHSDEEMLAAILNPLKYLQNIGPRRIQISASGIGFEISSTPRFDLGPPDNMDARP